MPNRIAPVLRTRQCQHCVLPTSVCPSSRTSLEASGFAKAGHLPPSTWHHPNKSHWHWPWHWPWLTAQRQSGGVWSIHTYSVLRHLIHTYSSARPLVGFDSLLVCFPDPHHHQRINTTFAVNGSSMSKIIFSSLRRIPNFPQRGGRATRHNLPLATESEPI